MQGTMITIPPDGPQQRTHLTAAPALETLQKTVGGYIEAVPHFTTLRLADGYVPCVALCNEDGKRMQLAHNPRADRLWSEAMHRAAGCGPAPDYLVGTIVVLIGDAEFMAAL